MDDDGDSQFAKWAVREGDWNTFQRIASQTHREAAILRSAFLQKNGIEGDDIKYFPYESPLEMRDRIAELEESERDVEPNIIASLFGE